MSGVRLGKDFLQISRTKSSGTRNIKKAPIHSGMDMSIVLSVISEIAPKLKGTEKIVIIKSTTLPGTTAGLAKKYPDVHFAMNQEFLAQSNAEKDFLNPVRTIIGAGSN